MWKYWEKSGHLSDISENFEKNLFWVFSIGEKYIIIILSEKTQNGEKNA